MGMRLRRGETLAPPRGNLVPARPAGVTMVQAMETLGRAMGAPTLRGSCRYCRTGAPTDTTGRCSCCGAPRAARTSRPPGPARDPDPERR